MNKININNVATSSIQNLKIEVVDTTPINKNPNTLYISRGGRELVDASEINVGNNKIKYVYLGSKKIWDSSEKENQTFSLLPIVMDSNSNLRLTFVNTYPTIGNSTFIMKPLSNKPLNLSDIDIFCNTSDSGTPNKVLIQKIDNFALLFERSAGHGTWPGGTTGTDFDEETSIRFRDISYNLTFKGRADENNTSLLEGAYVNKIVKIPSCGKTGFQKILFYPYTFYDKYYSMKNIDTYLIDYNDQSNDRKNFYLWNNDDKIFNKNGIIKTLNDTIFSSLNIKYEYLEGIVEYSIAPNETNEFRDTAIYSNQVLIHFIQEPHNDHRIYIRRDRRRALDTKYVENDDGGEFMFNLFESQILENTIEINSDISTSNTGTYVVYPINIENEYDIITEGACTLDSKTYYWDNLEFKRYICNKNSKIIFDKK